MWMFLIALALMLALFLYLGFRHLAYQTKIMLPIGAMLLGACEVAGALGVIDWSQVLPSPYAGILGTVFLALAALGRFWQAAPVEGDTTE